ncbi:MAG: beta-propeller fold lactonase family protein, partial [Bacteroidota bacterium]
MHVQRLTASLFFCFIAHVTTAQPGPQSGPAPSMLLPNGWSLTPAGTSITLGDLPLNIALSPDNKLAAVTNNGQSTQSIQLIDLQTRQVLDTRVIKKSWLGLAFSDDARSLYASGGNDNIVVRFRTADKTLVPTDTFILGKPWPVKISPAGLVVDSKSEKLFVVTKEDNALYIFNTRNRSLLSRIKLGTEGYTCLLSPDRQTLYISGWGADAVIVFDVKTNAIKNRIQVGDNPNDMAITKNGKLLFVANANDNSVSVVDLMRKEVTGVIQAALYPNSPPGSTTNSVALGNNDKTLYIANADNNCLAVIDLSVKGAYRPKGFIPVGWYPTCVRTVGNTVMVANGKGFSSLANPDGPNPAAKREQVGRHVGDGSKPKEVQYIAGLFKGTLSFIGQADDTTLDTWTKQVYRNTPYIGNDQPRTAWATENPIPSQPG